MKKGIQKKVVIFILLVGIFPLIAGITLTYFYGMISLKNSIGTNFKELARETAKGIDLMLNKEIDELAALFSSSEVKKLLNNPPGPPLVKGGEEGFSKEYLNSITSENLRSYAKYRSNEYYNILLTDIKGRVVLSSTEVENLYRGDEKWWKEAYNGGKGRRYISDFYQGKDKNRYLLDIAIPVVGENERVIGIAKFSLFIDDFFNVILDVKVGETGHANLINSDGTIIACPNFPPQTHNITPDLLMKIMKPETGWAIAEDDAHGGKGAIIGFSPIGYTFQLGSASFGGKKWYVFIRQNPEETFAPIYDLLFKISFIGFILIISLSIVGMWAARKMVKPIYLLQEGVGLIGQGNLDHRLDIRTGDEIEQLSEGFNQMAEKLKCYTEHLEDIVKYRTVELKETTDYLNNIMETADDIICTLDMNGNFTFLNKKITELGFKREDIIGNPLCSILAEPDECDDLLTTLQDGMKRSVEAGIKEKDGKIKNFLINTSPLNGGNGKITGMLCIARDTTEQRRFEFQLIEAERLAAMGQLSVSIAHDIRNPLSSVKMTIQEFCKRDNLSANDRKRFNLAREGVELIEKILKGVLDYAKPSSLKAGPSCNINSVIKNSLKLVKHHIECKKIHVIKELDWDLPAIHCSMHCDSVKLSQALLNIYLNSIQSMESNGMLRIKTSLIPPSPPLTSPQSPHLEGGERGGLKGGIGGINGGEKIKIEISDTGCGIRTENLKHIFVPFFTTKSDGIGIGLTNVKRVIEEHKGSIDVSSEVGKGTAFTILLPVKSNYSEG
ncbi:MAG: PAS domain S-box protein [Nitrospinae bacterium]|nr:PAS domain S-box protein [Nitrospinota bacterium]